MRFTLSKQPSRSPSIKTSAPRPKDEYHADHSSAGDAKHRAETALARHLTIGAGNMHILHVNPPLAALTRAHAKTM
jgi:hypothetical protein